MLIKIRIYNSRRKYVRNNFFFRWQNITWNRRSNFQNISSVTTSKWNWQKRKLRIKLYAKIKSFRLDKYPHDKIYAPPKSRIPPHRHCQNRGCVVSRLQRLQRLKSEHAFRDARVGKRARVWKYRWRKIRVEVEDRDGLGAYPWWPVRKDNKPKSW